MHSNSRTESDQIRLSSTCALCVQRIDRLIWIKHVESSCYVCVCVACCVLHVCMLLMLHSFVTPILCLAGLGVVMRVAAVVGLYVSMCMAGGVDGCGMRK